MNNCGVIFTFLPKIPAAIPPNTECDWILSADVFGRDILSPEELRYIDYSMKLKEKHPSTIGIMQKVKKTKQDNSIFRRGTPINAVIAGFPILHSLPIIYPYDESKSKKQSNRSSLSSHQ